jgi:hypothetical protein
MLLTIKLVIYFKHEQQTAMFCEDLNQFKE